MVDASNAFNCLNRKAGLQKVRSHEGTTQGDTTAMALYALSIMIMVKSIMNDVPNVKQVFYADDVAGGGDLVSTLKFWEVLKSEGHKNRATLSIHQKPFW